MVVKRPVAAEEDEIEAVDTLEITNEDAAFILGKGGQTKVKIAKVSGCQIDLIDGPLLEFRGSTAQRRRGKKYCEYVIAQKDGPVMVDKSYIVTGCTIVKVPEDARGFVMGKSGAVLRAMEDEEGVLMFFATIDGVKKDRDEESLIIFGSRPGRRSAQLRVMSAVEGKVPGYYTQQWRDTNETFDQKSDLTGDWATTTIELSNDEISFAIGSGGKTRKKLARASSCIIAYIGNIVFLSGAKKQRSRAEEYLKMLLEQLDGVYSVDAHSRDDCSVLPIPADCVSYITGKKRQTLQNIEEECGTLMMFLEEKTETRDDGEHLADLAIFGPLRARRSAELEVMSAVEYKAPGYFANKCKDRKIIGAGFGIDRWILAEYEMRYAIGREGRTRRKIATASGAILQFVGNVAHIAGNLVERERCRQYLKWLFDQQQSDMVVNSVADRSDVTEVALDGLHISAHEQRTIEDETGTFLFVAPDADGVERLLIFGHNTGEKFCDTGRSKAEKLAKNLFKDKRQSDWNARGATYGRSGNRWDAVEHRSWGKDHETPSRHYREGCRRWEGQQRRHGRSQTPQRSERETPPWKRKRHQKESFEIPPWRL